jgi:hypothetical protein
MEGIHPRHPGGTPEDEAAAVRAPRAFEPSAAAARAALASAGAWRAAAAAPLAPLAQRAAASSTAVAAALARAPRYASASSSPARPRRRAKLAAAALAALAAAAAAPRLCARAACGAGEALAPGAGAALAAADALLLRALFALWMLAREPRAAVGAAWVAATAALSVTFAGRRVRSRARAPSGASLALSHRTACVLADCLLPLQRAAGASRGARHAQRCEGTCDGACGPPAPSQATRMVDLHRLTQRRAALRRRSLYVARAAAQSRGDARAFWAGPRRRAD